VGRRWRIVHSCKILLPFIATLYKRYVNYLYPAYRLKSQEKRALALRGDPGKMSMTLMKKGANGAEEH